MRQPLIHPGDRFALRAIAALSLLALAACATPQSTGSSDGTAGGNNAQQAAPAEPDADYVGASDHFVVLQSAGLSANYKRFAENLDDQNPDAIVAQLMANFGGAPFDVYTQKSSVTQGAQHRIIELRSTGGRLYLYVHLDQVSNGWNLAGYQLDRNRAAVTARL